MRIVEGGILVLLFVMVRPINLLWQTDMRHEAFVDD